VSGDIDLHLTEDEAEWLTAVMGLVMELARHWDDRTAKDMGNAFTVKLGLAKLNAHHDQ
jgi:hypothetical protein